MHELETALLCPRHLLVDGDDDGGSAANDGDATAQEHCGDNAADAADAIAAHGNANAADADGVCAVNYAVDDGVNHNPKCFDSYAESDCTANPTTA